MWEQREAENSEAESRVRVRILRNVTPKTLFVIPYVVHRAFCTIDRIPYRLQSRILTYHDIIECYTRYVKEYWDTLVGKDAPLPFKFQKSDRKISSIIRKGDKVTKGLERLCAYIEKPWAFFNHDDSVKWGTNWKRLR